MPQDLSNWQPCPRPDRKTFDGRYIRLEPLDASAHADGLFAASSVSGIDTLFRYLPDLPPASVDAFKPWLEMAQNSADPIFFTCFDQASGQIAGRQTLMRIDEANGVAEIGNIYWGPLMARKPAATEALYLWASYLFDELGYRRFEWKCNNDNAPSKRAAERFGFRFEGVFRQHMIVKGQNRDTAWFAMTDRDWAALKPRYQAWLAPDNFDAQGQQIKRLQDL